MRVVVVSAALAATAVCAGSLSAAAGDLDQTFDGDGKVTLDLGSPYDSAYDVAVQRDGKILVAGETYPGAWNFALARYNRNGSPDTSFGTGGIVHTEFGWGAGVAVQSDGKIVMVGGGSLPGGTSLDFAVVRYNVDGSLDASFGAEGKAVADFGTAIRPRRSRSSMTGGSSSWGGPDGFVRAKATRSRLRASIRTDSWTRRSTEMGG
jgi:uncharacterized delta-60 repeat protein